MFIIKQLKRNFSYLLCNFQVGNNAGKGIESTVGKGNEKLELSLEKKKEEIKELLTNSDLKKGVISLDNVPNLKEKILQGIKKNTLTEDQINKIYKELHNIKNVESNILTDDVIKSIEQGVAIDKFDKLTIKIQKIQEIASYEQKKDILEAETLICEALGECEGLKSAEKELKSVEKNLEKNMQFSKEELSTINNKDFLKLTPEQRLIHITKNNISSKEVSVLKVKKLQFTFTFNGKFNEELYMQTTAGQVLPQEVEIVEKNGITYKRDGLKGEFFSDGKKRLTIKDIDKYGKQEEIHITKFRTKEDIKNLQNDNKKLLSEIKNDIKFYKAGIDDLIEEAIKRDIKPKFAIIAFEDEIKNTSNIFDRKVKIEQLLTEYARLKGKNPKISEEGIQILMLKKVFEKDWKQKAQKIGIPDEEIKKYENLVENKDKKYIINGSLEDSIDVGGKAGKIINFANQAVENKDTLGAIHCTDFVNKVYEKTTGKRVYDSHTLFSGTKEISYGTHIGVEEYAPLNIIAQIRPGDHIMLDKPPYNSGKTHSVIALGTPVNGIVKVISFPNKKGDNGRMKPPEKVTYDLYGQGRAKKNGRPIRIQRA